MTLSDPAHSRAFLIGACSYPMDAGLPDTPAVSNNLNALHAILTDPQLGGLPQQHCDVVCDPTDANELARRVKDAAAEAKDVFLVYFSGHGLIDQGSESRLYLATSHAQSDEPHLTCFNYDDLGYVLAKSDARRKIVILDCCFSGRAHGTLANAATQVASRLDIRGTCVLAATTSNQKAMARPGDTFTAYTGHLIDVLRNGIAGGPELINISTLHDELRRRFPRNTGLPQPTYSGKDTIAQLALVRNAAWRSEPGTQDRDLAPGPPTQAEWLKLGEFHQQRGELSEAERYYGNAADAGNTDAMSELGKLLADRGELAEAERWYRLATAARHPGAMSRLALLLGNDNPEARALSQHAAETEDPSAMAQFAFMLAESGEAEHAEQWFRRAAEAGHADAMHDLGALLDARDELDEAEQWFRRAAEAGHISAMRDLGALLGARDELDEAEQWFRRAAEAGHIDAMYHLGELLTHRSERGEAACWFRKAAEAGHVEAMMSVGVQLLLWNELDDAERWCRKAAVVGYPDVAEFLATVQEVRERRRRDAQTRPI